MDILLLRHGIAEDPFDASRAGRDELHRELTEDGLHQIREVCSGLASLSPGLNLVLTSPLIRAVQTAEILAGETIDLERLECLSPGGDLTSVCNSLVRAGVDSAALVGHEPDLGKLCGMLLTGKSSGLVELKKAGAVLIRSDAPGSGDGLLIWALPPSASRGLREP